MEVMTCSDRRVDAGSPRLRAVFFGGEKRFYTASIQSGPQPPAPVCILAAGALGGPPGGPFGFQGCTHKDADVGLWGIS